MKVGAILLAGGSSTRYGRDKLQEMIGGVPVWLRAFRALHSHPQVDAVGVVCTAGSLSEVSARAPEAAFAVLGGASRVESSRAGFAALPQEIGLVLVHDAARPFVTHEVMSRVIEAAARSGAAFPAVPIVDTLRRSTAEGFETLDRSAIAAVQTPQAARRDLLGKAYAAADPNATDDIALLEAVGVKAEAVQGDPMNRKVTEPGDLPAETETRTGMGYDVHRFSQDPARPMWLGGIELPDRPGLEGHSDADAVLHAVVDAVLGAAGLGDIGQHFPDTDAKWKDQPSDFFLNHAATATSREGWTIINIDVSVIAEHPKIAPYRDAMRRRIADIAGIDESRVNLKATTHERLGALGRGEGLAAMAVATLTRTTR